MISSGRVTSAEVIISTRLLAKSEGAAAVVTEEAAAPEHRETGRMPGEFHPAAFWRLSAGSAAGFAIPVKPTQDGGNRDGVTGD